MQRGPDNNIKSENVKTALIFLLFYLPNCATCQSDINQNFVHFNPLFHYFYVISSVTSLAHTQKCKSFGTMTVGNPYQKFILVLRKMLFLFSALGVLTKLHLFSLIRHLIRIQIWLLQQRSHWLSQWSFTELTLPGFSGMTHLPRLNTKQLSFQL